MELIKPYSGVGIWKTEYGFEVHTQRSNGQWEVDSTYPTLEAADRVAQAMLK